MGGWSVYRVGEGCGDWTEPSPGELREETKLCPQEPEEQTWPHPEEPCLVKVTFSSHNKR